MLLRATGVRRGKVVFVMDHTRMLTVARCLVARGGMTAPPVARYTLDASCNPRRGIWPIRRAADSSWQ
jgi:hypothetical protein